MAKNLKIAILIENYGPLLSEKQRRLVELYYYEDLSLSEISELENITRQGARDSIRRAVEKLSSWENKLGYIRKTEEIKNFSKTIERDIPERLLELINNL